MVHLREWLRARRFRASLLLHLHLCSFLLYLARYLCGFKTKKNQTEHSTEQKKLPPQMAQKAGGRHSDQEHVNRLQLRTLACMPAVTRGWKQTRNV